MANYSGSFSGSFQGTISGSLLGSGIVSGSTQIDFNSIVNKPTTIQPFQANSITSNNNFHRTGALQNFKYFFIKNSAELDTFLADINIYFTTTTRFTNMKLIDFFIPEIKFLLFHHFIQQLQELPRMALVGIQSEWNTYAQQYNFRFTTIKIINFVILFIMNS